MKAFRQLVDLVTAHGSAALISVHDVKGSAPRDVGARMTIRPDGAFHGTIGGGQLEMKMLSVAADMMRRGDRQARLVDQALGPDLGQCCGGRVKILVETFYPRDLAALQRLAEIEEKGPFTLECRLNEGRVHRDLASSVGDDSGTQWREDHGEDRTPVLLFGAGHVGRALVLALAPLPFRVRWYDSRPDAFPLHVPRNAEIGALTDPDAAVAAADPNSLVLVMTHDHPLDLALTAAALGRDFPYLGLIGSASKRARFEKRLREFAVPEERIARLVCPVGIAGIADKDPAIIAAAIAAQLLQVREGARAGAFPPLAANDREPA